MTDAMFAYMDTHAPLMFVIGVLLGMFIMAGLGGPKRYRKRR